MTGEPVWADRRTCAKRYLSIAGLTILIGAATYFLVDLVVFGVEQNTSVATIECGTTIFGIAVGLYLLVEQVRMLELMWRLEKEASR